MSKPSRDQSPQQTPPQEPQDAPTPPADLHLLILQIADRLAAIEETGRATQESIAEVRDYVLSDWADDQEEEIEDC